MADKPSFVQEAFRFAIAPTPRQERQLQSHAGAARFAYNWGSEQIAAALDRYQKAKAAGVPKDDLPSIPKHFDLCKMWTAHKDAHDGQQGRPADLAWVGENFVGTYQTALRDTATAWKNFIDSKTGRRKGHPVGRPRFKSRRKTQPAFQMHGNTVRIESQVRVKRRWRSWGGRKNKHQTLNGLAINLPKIGRVAIMSDHDRRWLAGHRDNDDAERNRRRARTLHQLVQAGHGRISRVNITREPDGIWFASVTVELCGPAAEQPAGPSRRQRDGGTVGVDLGVKYLAVLSSGQEWDNPRRYAASMAKLRVAQRALSRTQEDSRRRQRARVRVAALHARVRRARSAATGRAVTQLVRRHDRIVVEGWNVQQTMAKSDSDLLRSVRSARNRALADSARGDFRNRLMLAGPKRGCAVTVLDPHTPTGRTCSRCGTVRDKPIPPGNDKFDCPACGYVGDRRHNTARVLASLAATQAPSPEGESRGGSVGPETPRGRRQLPSKRAARSRSTPDWDKTGTPDP
ncbi:RNA-guided endonuclease InsQ/TnpB family protein [Nonomuraea polychroma]|uniref:RNA-guided endonuclease InsQ/TnpB family protein n=1 Tax=Nonomuraea polychroma TaxID=46176 RepID=UPI003D8AD6B4